MTRYLNIDLDTTLGGVSPSDELVSSQKAIKTYVDGIIPSQVNNASKFLTTDGSVLSWSSAPLVNKNTSAYGILVSTKAGTTTGAYSTGIGYNVTLGGNALAAGYNSKASGSASVALGSNGATATGQQSIAVGAAAKATAQQAIAIGGGYTEATNDFSVAISTSAKSNADYAIQIGKGTNASANTFSIGNNNGNFEMMSADGTIPADRLPNAINKYSTMPTADSTNEGWIVQYIGTSDSTYSHGYLYECVSDGQNPATYSWTAVELPAIATKNANTASGATSTIYDWVGTLSEYQTQNIATAHPTWICYITDDYQPDSPTSNNHEVIDFQAPTSSNNYTWYRKYADGWVEQGGRDDTGTGTKTINLPVTMQDAYYTVTTATVSNTATHNATVLDPTTTSFKAIKQNTTCYWVVEGMYA